MTATESLEQRAHNLLEANVTAELRLRRRLLELVEAQEQAVLMNEREAVEAAVGELEVELMRAAALAGSRKRMLDQLAALWGLAPGALTLGSVVERLGSRAESLGRARGELRGVVANLARRNRRLGALVALQRRIVREVVATVLDSSEADLFGGTGAVLSTEA